MVTEQDHHSIVRKAEGIERIEHLPYLGVHIAHAGIVAVLCLLYEINVVRLCSTGVGVNLRGVLHLRRQTLGTGHIVRHRYLLPVIHVPVPARGVERQVRLPEPACEEKRLAHVLQSREVGYGLLGKFPVIISIVRDIGPFTERASAVPGVDGAGGRLIHPELPSVVFGPIHIVSVRMCAERRFAPCVRVVLYMMEHLPVGDRMVPV